jgi:enterobactin synthetase component D
MDFEYISLASHPGGLPDAVALGFDPSVASPALFTLHGVTRPSSLAHAVTRRNAEYLAGRRAALRALADAGVRGAELGVGPMRGPQWPRGYIGSITHADNMAVAVVVQDHVLRGVGLDLEPIASDDGVSAIMQVALSPDEIHALGALATHVGMPAAVTAAFSAKESFYKATAATVGRVFEFTALRITSASFGSSCIEAVVSEALAPSLVPGRRFLLGCSFLDDTKVLTTCAWHHASQM